MGAALVLGLSLAASSASIDSYLTSIAVQYESLDYEKALEQVQHAKRFSRGPRDDVALAAWRGILLAELKQADAAAAAFREALSLDLEATLPTKVAPSISSLLERVRAEVRSLKVRPVERPEPAPPLAPPAAVSATPARGPRLAVAPVVLAGLSLLAGAGSLGLGLGSRHFSAQARAAYYQADAIAPVQSASFSATGSLVAGLVAAALLAAALALFFSA